MSAVAGLINLLGFITGAALYAMLLVMSLGQSRNSPSNKPTDRLPLLTAVFGLAWSVGALASFGLRDFGVRGVSPWLVAASFTALGFLPAVVAHSVLRTEETLRSRPPAMALAVAAYALSGAAGLLHFYEAAVSGVAPSHWALHLLTAGFGALIVALLLAARRQGVWRRAGWGIALAVFAVSAQHLSHHEGRDYAWWIELSGHHASLPLAVAILYQDYRFALADIFLKRALILILLVALAFGLYQSVAAPLLATPGGIKPFAVGVLLALWVATAIVYPILRRAVNWVVDSLLLRRADYDAVRAEAAARIETLESSEEILNEVCSLLARALTARDVRWVVASDAAQTTEVKSPTGSLRHRASLRSKEAVTVAVLTTELPRYNLLVGELAGGRRLLSDDLAMLESVAVVAARRIDAVRVIHERCVRDLHEQEMHKLATEAELRALRAQINPHFLFNALTTLGYLIQTAPDRAGETLMRLTTLLRAVLRHSDGEFTTLGDEIELIEAYLEIERARFEDRLRVTIDVPPDLRAIPIPALLVQPLVENAIKHGISPSRAGGDVAIEAGMSNGSLRISVRDTGLGASQRQLDHGRKRGVGLANVEQRIRWHYGDGASFSIRSAPGEGTTVELALPIHQAAAAISRASA